MNEEQHRKEIRSVTDRHVAEEVRGVLERPESEGKTSKLDRLLRFARYVAPVVLTLAGPVAAKAVPADTQQEVVVVESEACVPALNLIGMGLLGAGVAATGWASLYRKYKDKAERRQNDDLPGNAE